MRKIGLDLGDARIGIAVSDPMCIIASPLEVYRRQGLQRDIAYISELIAQKQADTAVLGLPLNMDGTKGARAIAAEEFGAALAKVTTARIEFIDERLTTVSAERALIEADMRREKRKEVIDKIAAQIILQSYLDKKK